MNNLKNRVLLTSAILVGLATTNGLLAAVLVTGEEIAARMTAVSTILGVGSIGLFFVGLALPATSVLNKSAAINQNYKGSRSAKRG